MYLNISIYTYCEYVNSYKLTFSEPKYKKNKKTLDKYTYSVYNIINKSRKGERMSKEDNKKDDQLIKLALATAVISLIDKLIELIIKIIDIVRA